MDTKSLMENAMQQHKKVIEMLYEDCCNIIEFQSVKDPITKVTSKKEVTVLENQPCNLTYASPRSANNTESATTIEQIPLLIISKDINIKAGSKIIITNENNVVNLDNPKTTAFKNSSVPSVYKTHQEISLELFNGWA